MFENIIGHSQAVSQLSRELKEGSFPSSVLISGPPYAGKLTMALEISRVLSCERDAAWDCPCDSCRRQRLLLEPLTLVVGPKRFLQEIRASWDTLMRAPGVATRFLFVRAVRKLTRRFDPVLWEGEEGKVRQAFDLVAEITELLEGFYPSSEGGELGEGLVKAGERILGFCRKLEAFVPRDGVPVAMVRRILSSVHLSSSRTPHVVILEHADTLQEASRNSLLKELEEPSAGTYFILLTRRRTAIIPTILSRVRHYQLFERSTEEMRRVLARIFRLADPPDHLSAFFHQFSALEEEGLAAKARGFVRMLMGTAAFDPALLDVPREEWEAWYEVALDELSSFLPSSPAGEVEHVSRLLSRACFRVRDLNMNPQTVLEALFLERELAYSGGRP
ncbi:DNA polymerase III subunit delta' [Spirochaeta thermophila]|uniref:DNA polymerase III domain protein n=1 Tax=Winmispira thermophila (strain ATCC 49972 / DSM 6192 / RI 19.B1) TaxID=665571 RepID=E0RQK7_WINT6|nr:hypothetical protein [Spirochaeta thermophila]ADN01511.1 DNA polymerase III domain protein [Spirochaeta thermophila DSM 6192]